MAFVIKDRIKETTTTTGTGAIALAGASATFDTFQSVLTNGDTTYYAIVHTTSGVDEWEVGLGTWNTGNTLTRTTVISGSNGTSAVDFQAGIKQIFITMPASKSTILDASGNVDLNGGTIDGTTIGASVAAAADFTTLDTTGDVVVGGELNVTEWIDLTAQTSNPAHAQGRLWYDNIHKTLNYYSDDSGVVHELGIEEHARVYNQTGASIAKGTPVYFSGSRSDSGTHVPTVAKANATSSTKYKSEGMTAATIANNSYGFVITAGRLEGLDTSHLSVGQFFTGITDGATQTMPPVYPNFPMCLGFVVRSNASDGVVFLAQQNHSIKTFRVQMDQHIGGDLTIDGDLNVSGSQNTTSTSDVTAGAPFYRANEGDAIGDANTTFTGSGLDDAFFAGHFTGTASTQYYVKIDNVSGAADTFSVSVDNFTSTITTGTAITGSEQMIHSADNISVNFGATTGHTLNDIWTGTAAPVNRDTGFFSNRNTGSSGVGYTHMGLFYDVSESKWRLVDEYDPVPAGTINTGHSSYVTGTIVGNVEGNVAGNVTGAVTGNATSATTLETARDIGGVSFNGSASINLPGVNAAGNQDTSGVAATATALATARTIALSGDVTGSVSFNGTGDVSITSTVLDDSHAHIVSNVDGLQAALDAKAPTARTLTAGAGLTGGGDLTANRTLAHADTSSQASVDGSGRTYIQDITLDTYGHVTGLATATETAVDLSAGGAIAGNITLTPSGYVSGTQTLAVINISSAGTGETRAIDIDGGWDSGESKTIGFIHGSAATNYVGAINSLHTNPSSSLRFGKLYHGADSTTYTMTLDSTSTSTANLTVSGNILASGTVDGRDVAADGTKLDTIATSANNYSFPYSVSTSESANTIAQRQANGYLFASYFNGSGTFGTSTSTGMGMFTGTNGSDTYGRSYSAANARILLNVANGANNYSLPADLTLTSVKFTTGPTLSEERDENLKLRGHSGSAVGISGYDSGNNWRFQLYGSSTQYGFLDGNWAAWDLRKVTNGNLFLNDNSTYYLNPASTTNINALTVAGVADFNGGHGAINITNSSILTAASSTWTGNPGANGKIQYHSNRWYIVGDSSANTNMITFRKDSSDVAYVTNVGAFNGSAVSVSGNVTAYSDERIKENIEVIPNALEKVLTLKGVTFDRTDVDIERQTGVIAQDVIKVLPEAISIDTNANGMYSVAYGNMVGLLIEAIKELKAEVEELKNGSTN